MVTAHGSATLCADDVRRAVGVLADALETVLARAVGEAVLSLVSCGLAAGLPVRNLIGTIVAFHANKSGITDVARTTILVGATSRNATAVPQGIVFAQLFVLHALEPVVTRPVSLADLPELTFPNAALRATGEGTLSAP
jgi:hypothetical protein